MCNILNARISKGDFLSMIRVIQEDEDFLFNVCLKPILCYH